MAALAATVAACGGDDDADAVGTTPTAKPEAPAKVVLYLQDGGCFSAETCAPENDLYNTSADEGPIGNRLAERGLRQRDSAT